MLFHSWAASQPPGGGNHPFAVGMILLRGGAYCRILVGSAHTLSYEVTPWAAAAADFAFSKSYSFIYRVWVYTVIL
ncbi:hypothetical protein [Paenibacillus chibensis]|uniref:hypothetical protein n=1 Tax=Paenibacillus chibensis TaxID=59846 RepID=UPI0013E2FA81|nr:hypothetical protein [Paenibacillus chibensis]MEC0370584.1 hypothetical protein [Paenibacillus chibensis]